ncbi:methyltransferase domain-containing protein [Vibrio sp.]|nr:methyltransferase domain-containing protein [Vibrio sp.]
MSNKSMDWDQLATDWDSNPEYQQRAKAAFRSILGHFGAVKGSHVLDIGCGTGLLTELLSEHAKSLVALDPSEAMIEQLELKELKHVEPVVDTLTRGLVAMHPAFEKQFDLITANSVLIYINNLSEVADIALTLLNKRGYFMAWDIIETEEVMDYTVRVKSVLNAVGFSGVSVTESVQYDLDSGRKLMMSIAQK